MESIVMICKYGEFSTVIQFLKTSNRDDLIQKLRAKWDISMSDSIMLTYSLPDDPICLLDSDEDLCNMFLLAEELSLHHVRIIVSVTNVVGEQISLPVMSEGQALVTVGVSGMYNSAVYGSGSVGVEEDLENVMASFVGEDENAPNLRSASWACGIKCVDQRFKDSTTFKETLSKYAAECGFDFKYSKNDQTRITAVCKYQATTGCMWVCHARKLNANQFYYIRKLNLEHTCGVNVRSSMSTRVSSNIVAKEITSAVRDDPDKSAIKVVKDIKDNYGFSISYHKAWLGLEKAKANVFGNYSKSYDSLRWYVVKAKETNPGSYFDLQNKGNNQFFRVFIAFDGCIRGFEFCRPLLFLDATFLTGKYKGHLLVATSKDGNNGNEEYIMFESLFPICYAIVETENQDNWHWFLTNLRRILYADDRTLTFVTDRHNGLVKGISLVFPESHHAYCLQHLYGNLRTCMKNVPSSFRDKMVEMLKKAAHAPLERVFNYFYNKMLHEGGKDVVEFLGNVHPRHWSHAHFPGERFGEMTSNAVESFNMWVREERHLPIAQLVDVIRYRIMDQMATRRRTALQWKGEICPDIVEKLRRNFQFGRTWNVKESNFDNWVFEVHAARTYEVNIADRTCTCGAWQANGIPCAHGICAIQKSGRQLSAIIDPYFLVDSFRKSYSFPINTVPTAFKEWEEDGNILMLPPDVPIPPGRPRKKRRPSKGEESTRLMTCSFCGTLGHHNRRGCNAIVRS